MIRTILKSITDILDNFYATFCGCIMAILGYFFPVKDIVHLLLLFFILDVIFGYWAARKLRDEKFSVKIIWSHTVPRMLLSIVLVLCAYMWDNVFGQEIVNTYKVVGWFIGGVLLYSIAQNGYHITKWKVLPKLAGLIGKKVVEKTGISIDEDESITNDKN